MDHEGEVTVVTREDPWLDERERRRDRLIADQGGIARIALGGPHVRRLLLLSEGLAGAHQQTIEALTLLAVIRKVPSLVAVSANTTAHGTEEWIFKLLGAA